MKHFLRNLSLFLLLAVAVAACGTKKDDSHRNPNDHSAHEQQSSGDIQEKTASANQLPSFLDGQSEYIRLVYEAAGKATGILEWMPCYCGCGEIAGHQSNLNCFIKEIQADGSVVWDDHGTRCGVCLQIAVDSIKMTQEGKSLKDIRAVIDQTYENGYGKPTKTPFPA